MLTRSVLRVVLSCLVFVGLGGVAQAQVSGAISVTGLQFTLSDLDPDDGIDPALTWVDSGAGPYWDYRRVYLFTGMQDQTFSYEGGYPYYSQTFSDSVETAGQDDLRLADGSVETRIDGADLTGRFQSGLGQYISGYGQTSRSFVLTAGTAVTFQANLAMDAEVAIPANVPYPHEHGGQPYVTLQLSGWMDVDGWVGDAHIGASSGDSRDLTLDEPGRAQSESVAQTLLVTFNNKGAQATTGTLFIQSSFFTQTIAVPEPATWVQMLMGVGALAWAAARRRRA